MSITKVSDMGVMASLAVFSVSSSAPAMIVVSSCVSSPPFPACYRLISDISGRIWKQKREAKVCFKIKNNKYLLMLNMS